MIIVELYGEHQAQLRRYATSLTQDADRAEDLVAETLLRALINLDLLDRLNPYQRRAWLFRVLRNRFIDEQRARRREQQLLEQLAQDDQGSFQAPPAVDILGLAPEKYRGLIEMRYYQGMTSDEIGRRTGLPAATVRSRLRLAIKWLQKHTKLHPYD
jgi:RNA polymerase sigma-70 factor (ECF subfamily)